MMDRSTREVFGDYIDVDTILFEYLTPDSNGSYWSKYIGNCDIYVADNEDGNISVPIHYKKTR
ncbi:hypothetical protein SAMN02910369_02376 [Lachnospiraceae bacterium NE2001]|nr:hypothetical protein SAMN02910369_02376 [Lachnospiraceae bacterium NE2001]